MSAVLQSASEPAGFRRRLLMEKLIGIGFAMPATLLLLTTSIAPLAVLIVLSFTDYELGNLDFEFIGVANFGKAMTDPVFRRSLWNTFLYVAIVLPLAVGLSLLVATLVHGRNRITRSFYEVVYFLPVTSTLIAMAAVWTFVLHPTLGPVNTLLDALGIGRQAFLSDPALVLPTLAMIGVWHLIGFNMVLFLAGLTAIPVIVTTSITAFKVFDTVAVMTHGGPIGASEVLLYAIYLEGFQYFHTAYAAALTLIFLVFILVFSVVQAFVLERRTHYG
jgi:multiple sugar transport system permease protein